jgi:hypothetical protein
MVGLGLITKSVNTIKGGGELWLKKRSNLRSGTG